MNRVLSTCSTCRRRSTAWAACAAALMLTAGRTAPGSAQAATQQPGQAPAAIAPAPTPPPETFTYNAEGRRDPFVSLLLRGSDSRMRTGSRVEGLPGLAIGEVALRGILKSRGDFIGLLQAPDGKTYVARPNDRLLDGVIKAITVDSVVFLQDVDDPLSLLKQREVRKTLRTVEEVK